MFDHFILVSTFISAEQGNKRDKKSNEKWESTTTSQRDYGGGIMLLLQVQVPV